MTTDAVKQLGDKWLPLTHERFFTPQRAPDMWFSDELPPSFQRELASPIVTQTKALVQFQMLQALAVAERQREAQAQQRRRVAAHHRIGKGRKARRH